MTERRAPEEGARPRLLRGRLPEAHEKERRELEEYESGSADRAAAQVPGPYAEPWLNVLAAYEPGCMPAFAEILATPELRRAVRGRVLDVGAGTCWLTAQAALLPEVEEVFAVDLSERFLTSVGARMLRHFGADPDKVTFVAGDFNSLPLPAASCDCAFLFAAIHHSLAPIKTLQEIGRCLRPGGALYVLENPVSPLKIRAARRLALAASAAASELAYTRGELEYLFAVAAIGPVEVFHPRLVPRSPLRGLARRALRLLRLEDLLLDPPAYLYRITRAGL